MELFSIVALTALIKKMYDTLGFLTNRKLKAFINQAFAYGLGVLVVVLAAHANRFANVDLGAGNTIGSLDGASQVLVGLSWGALAGVVGVDLIRGLDNSQSAATPPIVPGPDAWGNRPQP